MEEKEFNLDLLINKKVVVNCKTEDEANEFLKYLDSKGIKWNGGDRIFKHNYYNYNDFEFSTCFCLEYLGKLQYSPIDYFDKEEYKILSLDDIVVKSKQLNNFADYGFTADFEGEILKQIGDIYIGYVSAQLNIFSPMSWTRDGVAYGTNDLFINKSLSKYNLKLIKRPWYENPESRFKLVIYQDGLYTLSWWYKDTNNVELIDIKKATTQTVNVEDVRPATKEEIETLLIKH